MICLINVRVYPKTKTMKKIIIIILVVATILNLTAGAFIFLDIKTMNLPITTLTLELADLDANEALLHTTLQINNTNGFSLFVQNMNVTTVTEKGDVINYLYIKGGEIQTHENKTFSETTAVRFNNTIPNMLISRITGTVGLLFFGLVKKTFPLKFSMVISLHDIITQFALPHVHLEGNFSDVTQEGINFTCSAELTNPNTIDLAIENLSVNLVTEKGINVGTVTLQGTTIPGKTSRQLTGSGMLLLKALDARTLQMNLQGDVIVFVAGIRKSMNLSIDAELIPPRIKQLLSDLPTDASLTAHYKPTLKGVLDQIRFEVVNPNKLTVQATDITIQIFRIDRNKTRLICNGTSPDGVILPQTTTILQGDMIIPYSHLLPRFGERLFADRIQVILRANFTIQGINQTVWIGMVAYQDFPFHRP
jgi:LEA14-like dessication related protein